MTSFTGGPGFLAFVATFLLVGAVVLLMLSLSKHLRKVRTRPPVEERAGDAEEATAGVSDGSVVSAEPAGGAQPASATSAGEDDDGDGGVVTQEPHNR